MIFAKWTYRVAGFWGIAVLLPMLFLQEHIGQAFPPRITHPEFYYGFVCVGLAWQVAFLVVSTDPVRYRPLMPACMLEKFSFVTAAAFLWISGRVPDPLLLGAAADLILGVAFTAAYFGLGLKADVVIRKSAGASI